MSSLCDTRVTEVNDALARLPGESLESQMEHRQLSKKPGNPNQRVWKAASGEGEQSRSLSSGGAKGGGRGARGPVQGARCGRRFR